VLSVSTRARADAINRSLASSCVTCSRDSVSRDRDALSSFSASGDPERALLHEKLAASKRKNAALQEQLKSLESQVTQLTTKMSALHAHHKTSLIDVQDQTRHACAESHARHLAELEARARLEAGLARQVVEDQLAAERSFHTSVSEKIDAIASMFPEAYSNSHDSVPSPLADAMSGGESRNALHPNSAPRLQLTAFFESTRRALNSARHTSAELRSLTRETASTKMRAQEADEWRYASEKAFACVDRRAAELKAECDRARKERDEIVARVDEIERRRGSAVHAASNGSVCASSSASSTSPSAPRSVAVSTAHDDFRETRPNTRPQASVERLHDTEEEEPETNHRREDEEYEAVEDDNHPDEFDRTVLRSSSHRGSTRSNQFDLPRVEEEVAGGAMSPPSARSASTRRAKQ
jgi:chromosome segregation ATPase